MILDGEPVTGINQTNFGQYLGKIVTNYSNAPTTVTVGSNTYNVSNTYRLYWIDWTNKYGDGVGPSNNEFATENGYYIHTSNATVQTDVETTEHSSIDSMYYPGSGNYYWLASPSAYSTNTAMYVSGNYGGSVRGDDVGNSNAFCPLVSLQPGAQL